MQLDTIENMCQRTEGGNMIINKGQWFNIIRGKKKSSN